MDVAATIVGMLTNLAIAVGVWFAWCQLKQSKQQSCTEFEDRMAGEYRQLAHRLPVKALLGQELSDEEYAKALDEFYWYFDLSNEQVFLRQHSRITRPTWDNWRDGIRSNLSRPAFARAWKEIKDQSAGDFAELRQLEQKEFCGDPAKW